MLLVDVVKKKIYLHLKHLDLSCVRSRQFSPEHIKYRNRKPADLLTVHRGQPGQHCSTMWWIVLAGDQLGGYDMTLLGDVGLTSHSSMFLPPGPPGPTVISHMAAARRVFAVRGPGWAGRREWDCSGVISLSETELRSPQPAQPAQPA